MIFCPISEAIRDYPELVKQYLGTVVPGLDESSIDTPRSGFDADVYRILGRHLKNGARRVKPWPGLNAARAGSE
ncbi:MAG: hypothetical protein EBR15_03870 [Gammaproteobacteria bacterium]|nr:hypothetical protein [Gammaproteobacteria bacterium]